MNTHRRTLRQRNHVPPLFPCSLCAGPGMPVKNAKISDLFVFNAMGRLAVAEVRICIYLSISMYLYLYMCVYIADLGPLCL